MSRKLISALVLLIRLTASGAEDAEILITDTVAAANPERFGAHVQLEINQARYLDGSFEPVTFNRRFDVTGGGPNHAIIANAHVYDTMKDGYLNGAVAWIYRRDGEDFRLVRKSTVTQHFVGDPQTNTVPGRFEFADAGEAPQAGDFAFVRIEWLQPPVALAADRLRSFFSDVWILRGTGTGFIERDPTTVAPTNGGRTSLKLAASGAQELLVESHGQFDGAYQGFYPTLKAGRTYRLAFWAKAESQTATLRVNLTSVYQGLSRIAVLSNSWQEYTADFVAPAWSSLQSVSFCQIHLTGGPATAWIDNLSVTEIGIAPYEPDAEQVTNLHEFAAGSVRTFGAFNESQTLATWTDIPHLATINWSINTGGGADDGDKLPTVLRVAKAAGGIPWLVVGGQITEEEWPQLIEYLAAPFNPATDSAATKPWAAKRYGQGQAAPWIDEFPRIRVEFCNEAWNYFFAYNYDSVTYGRMAKYFLAKARTSPWWDDAKLEVVLNGWLLQPGTNGFGAVARRQAPFAEAVGVTAYIGGWERTQFIGGTNYSDSGVQDTLLYAAYDQAPYHRLHAATRRQMAMEGFPYQLFVYEAGPGYSLPNGGQPFIPVQERYGKSLAAGICTLDMLMFNSLLGYGAQNYYTFSRGFNWTSHALAARGGHPYPAWSALQLRNRYGRGDMLFAQTLRSPAVDVVRPAEGYDVRHIPLIQPYSFKNSNDYSVFLLSRSLSNSIPTTVRLPFSQANHVTLHRLTGDPRADNLESYVIREAPPEDVTAQLETNAAGSGSILRFGMPPGSAFVFEFSGTVHSNMPVPQVRVSQAPGQMASSSDAAVRFTVAFDRPVDGFEANDVVIEGTADSAEAGVAIEEVESVLGLGTTYTISISGLRSSGLVKLRIPAGRVQAREGGAYNTASVGSDDIVRFVMPAGNDRLISHEPFEASLATNGPVIDGLNDGFGFYGPWDVQNDDVAGYRLTESEPLGFGALATTGGYAAGGSSYLTAGRALDVAGSFENWRIPDRDPALIGRPGTVLWMSALLRKEAANDQPVAVALADTYFAWVLSDWRIAAGFFGASSRVGSTRLWSLQVRNPANDGDIVLNTEIPIQPGVAALLVLRIEFGTRDQVSLFVNPASLGGGEPDIPDLVYLTEPNGIHLGFRTLGYYGGDLLNQSSVDEIRFGDSFAAVTPTTGSDVPSAPASLVVGPVLSNALRVAWVDRSTNETGFLLQRRARGDAAWMSLTNLPPDSTEYIDTGLFNGATYTYRLQAIGSSGSSAWSSPAAGIVVGQPFALTVLQATNGQIELAWPTNSLTVLQYANRIEDADNWLAWGGNPTVSSGTNWLLIAPYAAQRFFRLLMP